jgi:hypothetical protein
MKKGVFKTLLFYGIGFGIAGIVSLTVKSPHQNAPIHGPVPELEHLIIFLTFFIGLIWTIVSFFRFLYNSKEKLKGIIITNGLMILSMLVFLYLLII